MKLICVIVNFGLGGRVLSLLRKRSEFPGAQSCSRTGDSRQPLVEALELTDIRKEVVLIVCEKSVGDNALAEDRQGGQV